MMKNDPGIGKKLQKQRTATGFRARDREDTQPSPGEVNSDADHSKVMVTDSQMLPEAHSFSLFLLMSRNLSPRSLSSPPKRLSTRTRTRFGRGKQWPSSEGDMRSTQSQRQEQKISNPRTSPSLPSSRSPRSCLRQQIIPDFMCRECGR